MATPQFTEEEVMARAQQLADEQGPGWEKIIADEQFLKDTVTIA
jgi:hypothetical protein